MGNLQGELVFLTKWRKKGATSVLGTKPLNFFSGFFMNATIAGLKNYYFFLN